MVSKSLFVALMLALLAFPMPTDPVDAATVTLTATLEGANEVGGGDPNGTGTAEIKLKAKKKKICFDISVSEIGLPATRGHIHQGEAGVNGDIFVALFESPDADGNASGCVRASRAKIKAIKDDPNGFYVNVHNGEFPNGAVRGQLLPSI